MKRLAESIDGACADIAIDDTKRSEHQRFHAFVMMLVILGELNIFRSASSRHHNLRRWVIAI